MKHQIIVLLHSLFNPYAGAVVEGDSGKEAGILRGVVDEISFRAHKFKYEVGRIDDLRVTGAAGHCSFDDPDIKSVDFDRKTYRPGKCDSFNAVTPEHHRSVIATYQFDRGSLTALARQRKYARKEELAHRSPVGTFS